MTPSLFPGFDSDDTGVRHVMVEFDDKDAGIELRKKKILSVRGLGKNATPIARTSFERAIKSQNKGQSFKVLCHYLNLLNFLNFYSLSFP